jgi:hypothetical protein
LTSAQLFQGVEGGFNDSNLVVRPVRFGKDILDSGNLTNRADGSASDDPRPRTRWHQEYLGRATPTPDGMWNRVFHQRDLDLLPGSLLGSLLDARRDFIRFPISPADFSLAVAHDHHRREAESAPAFNDRRAPSNLDRPL